MPPLSLNPARQRYYRNVQDSAIVGAPGTQRREFYPIYLGS